MNVNDTEIIYSILEKKNYIKATSAEDAEVILLMTCAIREGAEQKIWQRLSKLKKVKHELRKNKKGDLTVGVIGKDDIFTS